MFIQRTQFCTFRVLNFSQNVHKYVHSAYTFSRFSKKKKKKAYTFFKAYTQLCIFNVHNFLKNIYNSTLLK